MTTATSTEVALRPQCDNCGTYLELRDPPRGYTKEQEFCGVWYDHPAVGLRCSAHSTVLIMSPELIEQLESMKPGCTL